MSDAVTLEYQNWRLKKKISRFKSARLPCLERISTFDVQRPEITIRVPAITGHL
jgi:hypothetical protein